MERKLYSLEAINSKNRSVRHIIKVKNHLQQYEEKTYLANIDQHITTYFCNLEQLLYYLKKKNIIASKYDDIKITYHHSGICAINPVFQDQKLLNKISKNSKSMIDMEKNEAEFNTILKQFFSLCHDDSFYNLLNESKQIPEYLKSSIYRFHYHMYNDQTLDEIQVKISNALKNYKTLRTVILYIDSYLNNKKIENKVFLPPHQVKTTQIILPSQNHVEYDREEKEEFLSEGEIEFSYGEGGSPDSIKKI